MLFSTIFKCLVDLLHRLIEPTAGLDRQFDFLIRDIYPCSILWMCYLVAGIQHFEKTLPPDGTHFQVNGAVTQPIDHSYGEAQVVGQP